MKSDNIKLYSGVLCGHISINHVYRHQAPLHLYRPGAGLYHSHNLQNPGFYSTCNLSEMYQQGIYYMYCSVFLYTYERRDNVTSCVFEMPVGWGKGRA
jgi:hypothetical protein